jgi:pimeloyl-ACP methyl ester carboxylesterase
VSPPAPPPFAFGHVPGHGPLLVYLHGLGCAGSLDWPRVASAPALQGRASLWVDLLGFGQSPRPQDFSYDLLDQARGLEQLLADLPGPLALVGHSMGGALAVLLAERLLAAGRALDAVLLAEPNLRAEDATLSAKTARTPLPNFLRRWNTWRDALTAPAYRQSVALADPVAFHRSAVCLVAHGATLLPRFVALSVRRKGFVLGGQSRGAAVETARRVAEAGVPVAVVERAGHDLSADHPEGFAEAIAQLLA